MTIEIPTNDWKIKKNYKGCLPTLLRMIFVGRRKNQPENGLQSDFYDKEEKILDMFPDGYDPNIRKP